MCSSDLLVAASTGMADIVHALSAPVERTRQVLPSPGVEAGPLESGHEAPITRARCHGREHLS